MSVWSKILLSDVHSIYTYIKTADPGHAARYSALKEPQLHANYTQLSGTHTKICTLYHYCITLNGFPYNPAAAGIQRLCSYTSWPTWASNPLEVQGHPR
jgi:hypothetical protein